MAFGKHGDVPASRLSKRIASTVKPVSDVVELKPTAYDMRRQADILAKAATDQADARYVKIAVISCLVILAVVSLYSIAGFYLAPSSPPRLRP